MKVATLCYLQDKGCTLMMYRNKKKNDIHKNKWNGLGGKLESGESPEDCVIREVKEESGYDIIEPVLKGVITFPKFDLINDWLVFVYICDQFKGRIIQSEEGTLKWIVNKELLNLNLWEGDKIFLKWIFDASFFSAKFIYKESKLITYKVKFYKTNL